MHEALLSDALQNLAGPGVHVVEGFLAPASCGLLREEIDYLFARYKAYVRTDPLEADMRLFGADRVSLMVAAFFNDPTLRRIIERHEGAPSDGVAMVSRLTYRPGNRGSGQGWHRDSTVRRQTKAIIYLSDVGPDDGPFEYITGSALPENIAGDNALMGVSSDDWRLGGEQVNKVVSGREDAERVSVLGGAGTLVLADTSGIHRGAPSEGGVRYACTTYLWREPEHIPPELAECFVPSP